MKTYAYTATDSSGKTKQGTVQALSVQAAREAVVEMNLQPVELYEAPSSSSLPSMEHAADPTPPPLPLHSIESKQPAMEPPTKSGAPYFPLLDTLRLYAGWLLAWYCLVYIIGSYQYIKELPFRIPYAESLFLSPLVLSFTFAAYLFLLLSGIYRFLNKKSMLLSIVFLLIGIGIFITYRVYIG